MTPTHQQHLPTAPARPGSDRFEQLRSLMIGAILVLDVVAVVAIVMLVARPAG